MDPVKQKFDEAYALLTRAGAPYELVTETVDGQPLRAFRNTPRNMRELFAPAYQHGDKEFVVFEGERWSFARLLRLADSIAHQLGPRRGARVRADRRGREDGVLRPPATRLHGPTRRGAGTAADRRASW